MAISGSGRRKQIRNFMRGNIDWVQRELAELSIDIWSDKERCYNEIKKLTNQKRQEKRNYLSHRRRHYKCLNDYFEGSEGHHVNDMEVIWIPKKLHRNVSHNLKIGRNMNKINALAFKFLFGNL